jgi:hypothetical protein
VVANALSDIVSHFNQDRVLAYDHHGNPGIAFYDAVDNDLRYARRVPGVGWVHSEVDTTGSIGLYPSLAYDRYERPAISYQGSGLKYAHFNGSTWDIETIESTGIIGRYTSLAFDVLGHPAIAYRDDTNSSLKYVRDTDGDSGCGGVVARGTKRNFHTWVGFIDRRGFVKVHFLQQSSCPLLVTAGWGGSYQPSAGLESHHYNSSKCV